MPAVSMVAGPLRCPHTTDVPSLFSFFLFFFFLKKQIFF